MQTNLTICLIVNPLPNIGSMWSALETLGPNNLSLAFSSRKCRERNLIAHGLKDRKQVTKLMILGSEDVTLCSASWQTSHFTQGETELRLEK